MDYTTISLSLFFLCACIHLLITTANSISRKSGTATLPPGPNPFPIIGNILEIGHLPHQSLANLSKIYGPLMSLRLGSMTTIVVSSPKFAKEVLRTHDLALSSHTILHASRAHDHHIYSMTAMPVGSKWRNLRKICKEYMFSTVQLDASQVLRRKNVQELIDYVHGCCSNGEAVDIGRAVFTTSLNLISNTIFSIDLANHNSSSSQEIKEIVWEVMKVVGKPDIANYFPLLGSIDPQGTLRRAKISFGKLLGIFDGIINQRLQSRASSPICLMSNDILDGLLDLSQENGTEFSYNVIKHLLLDLFVGGTDTTSNTVEWAMTELLHNPDVLAKAKSEVVEVISNEGSIQESDISKLPYLQAVVKETLRLHPPGPFLIPHKAESDVEMGNGFVVPKNAHILVNLWAIGRDSSVWLNPNLFMPERFVDCEVDFRGRDFELIPFGSGRRMCPGLPLADRMVHLVLGSLLYSFDWKLEEGMEVENMDMSEKFGLALHKATPLKAIPIKLDVNEREDIWK